MTWKILEPLLQTETGEIRSAVRGVTEAWGRKARRDAVRNLAAVLDDKKPGFILRLLDETSAPPRRLALELIPGLAGITAHLRRNSREALRDRRIPHSTRLAATKALIRGLDPAGKGAALMLRAYVAGLGRKRILERLDEVAKDFDNPPAMEFVRVELMTLEKLRCPRCGSLRRRKNMAEHLWNRHQMLLVGHRARTAMQALDDKLAVEPPNVAITEFHRDLLAQGLHDDEAVQQLRQEANSRQESICPHCHAFVPLREPPAVRPAEVALEHIHANGCAVMLYVEGGQSRLRIHTESMILFDGPDPAASHAPAWCLRWAMLCSLAAIVAASLLPTPWQLLDALGLVIAAGALLALANRWSRKPYDTRTRVVDLAWQRLIPELKPGDALARIALASVDRGSSGIRTLSLARAIYEAEQATALGAVPGNRLSPLWWLQFTDEREDPLPALISRFRRCLENELPLSAAASTLELWQRDRPDRVDRARMRALLCEQAFDYGLGVWDLVELGRAFPPMGFAFATDDLDGLAQLCLLWELRQTRPWQRLGPAATVFELAKNADLAQQVLQNAGDVLLYHRIPLQVGDVPESIMLCGRGMLFRDAVVREPPGEVRIRQCEPWQGGGFELRLGPHRFRFQTSPAELGRRLQSWSDYILKEFLPGIDRVLKYRSSRQLAGLLEPYVTHCPQCAKSLVPLPGQIGIAGIVK